MAKWSSTANQNFNLFLLTEHWFYKQHFAEEKFNLLSEECFENREVSNQRECLFKNIKRFFLRFPSALAILAHYVRLEDRFLSKIFHLSTTTYQSRSAAGAASTERHPDTAKHKKKPTPQIMDLHWKLPDKIHADHFLKRTCHVRVKLFRLHGNPSDNIRKMGTSGTVLHFERWIGSLFPGEVDCCLSLFLNNTQKPFLKGISLRLARF